MIGTILSVNGSWGSGLASLVVRHEDGTIHNVYADNGPLIRALESAFGDVIAPGHTFNPKAVTCKKIDYELDDTGLILAGFNPVDKDTESYQINHGTATPED